MFGANKKCDWGYGKITVTVNKITNVKTNLSQEEDSGLLHESHESHATTIHHSDLHTLIICLTT